jgi:uncharacterized membrane protein
MINSSHFHPMLVHFPIALITVGFLFDLAALILKKDPCLSRSGFWLSLLGMLGAMAAWTTGYFLTDPMEGEAGLIRERHELFATATMIVIVVAVLCRVILAYLKKQDKSWAYLTVSLMGIAFMLVSITGFLGGTLVMEYMIGL